MSIENWTWNTTAVDNYPDNTYLTAGVYLGFESKRKFGLEFYNDSRTSSVKGTFGAVALDFTLDLGMILDGNASLSSWYFDYNNFTLDQGTELLAFEIPINFCEPVPDATSFLHKWSSVVNDPSITAIFTDFGSPTTPRASKDRTTTIVVAVVVSVLVAIAIVTIVLLVIYNPSVRDFFMPNNSKRIAEARKPTGQLTDKHSSWQPSEKPLIS